MYAFDMHVAPTARVTTQTMEAQLAGTGKPVFSRCKKPAPKIDKCENVIG